ncbi:MAG TPA: hypothetical protein ACHBX0_13680 [Arsenophonus sp.]
MSFDRQLNLLEKNSQDILNYCMKIFKKHSFNQLTNKQKEYLYIFIALMNFILTQNNKKQIYKDFEVFLILEYKCDISILDGILAI